MDNTVMGAGIGHRACSRLGSEFRQINQPVVRAGNHRQSRSSAVGSDEVWTAMQVRLDDSVAAVCSTVREYTIT